MSALAARKALKRSLKTIDEKRYPADHALHQALIHLSNAIQVMDDKLTRLEAAAGTTPKGPLPDPEGADEDLASP
jgi:hypothetical protein